MDAGQMQRQRRVEFLLNSVTELIILILVSSYLSIFFYLTFAISVFIFSGTSPVSQVDSKSKGDIVYHIVLKTGYFVIRLLN